MYDRSVPALTRSLAALSAIIDKAEAHCTARKIEPAALLDARLFPDMWTFARQVRAAADNGRRCVARLSGTEPVPMPDYAPGFDGLRAMLADTIALIGAAPRDAIESGAGRTLRIPAGSAEMVMTGPEYLRDFLMPNFYFHCAMAYAVLRANGVELAKQDFLGRT